MKKKYIQEKTKFTTNTYMREAINYEIIIESHKDYYITIKKYLELTDKFIIENTTLIDKDYFVVEITPLNENYNIRFYVDNNKNVIDYYIDITYQNGIKYKIPYYVDLYLDIIHYPNTNESKFYDEDELLDALNNKIISKKDYKQAYSIGNKLLKEIKQNNNKYLNLDIIRIINKYYK